MTNSKNLTAEEKAAIKTLKSLSKRWPEGIWLYCTGTAMHVFRCGENGAHIVDTGGSPDMDYEIDYISGIAHDGGDF